MIRPIITLIILCALTVTAWGGMSVGGEVRYSGWNKLDSLIERYYYQSTGKADQFTAPSGRVWQLVEDSVPVTIFKNDTTFVLTYPVPLDTIRWEYFLTWRQVEEEPDTGKAAEYDFGDCYYLDANGDTLHNDTID